MRWEDERYVRVYTRDTPDWLCLSFPAQGLFCLLLRKVDRAGVLPLGRLGKKGVAIAIGHAHQWPMLEPALEELLVDGCIQIAGDTLVVPNFLDAQEAEASDKARAKKSREKRRDLARLGGVTGSHRGSSDVMVVSQDVTKCHAGSIPRDGNDTQCDGSVTKCDETVTPSRTVPNRTVPNQQKHAATAPEEPAPPPALPVGAPEPGLPPFAGNSDAPPGSTPSWPLLEQFRSGFADRMAITNTESIRLSRPEIAQQTREALEAELRRRGVASVLDAVVPRAQRETRRTWWLSHLLTWIQDLPEGGQSPPRACATAPAAPPSYFGTETRRVSWNEQGQPVLAK